MMKLLLTLIFAFIAVSDCLAQGRSFNNCSDPSRPFFRWSKVAEEPAGPPLKSHQDLLEFIAPVKPLTDWMFNKAWHFIANEHWKISYDQLLVFWDAARQGEGTNLVRTEIKPCDHFADMIYGIPNRPAGMTVLFDPEDGKPRGAWVWKVDDRRELIFVDECSNVVQRVLIEEEKPEPRVLTEAAPTPQPSKEPGPDKPPVVHEKETIVHAGQPGNQAQGLYQQINIGGQKADRIEQPTLRTIARRQQPQGPVHYTASVGLIPLCNLSGNIEIVNGQIADGKVKCFAGERDFAAKAKDWLVGGSMVGFSVAANRLPGAIVKAAERRVPDQVNVSSSGVVSPNISASNSNTNGYNPVFSPDIANNPVANGGNSSATAQSGATASSDSSSTSASDARGGNTSVVVDNPPPVIVQPPPPPPEPAKNPFTPPPNNAPGGRP